LQNLLKRWEHRYLKPWLRTLKPWRRTTFGGVQITFARHLDGGGSTFGQEFIPFLQSRGMPVQPRAFEWCAGPGFIGFSLIGHGLCRTLCLADINPQAVAACRRTVEKTGSQTASASINPTTWPTSRRRNGGIWWSAIRRTS